VRGRRERRPSLPLYISRLGLGLVLTRTTFPDPGLASPAWDVLACLGGDGLQAGLGPGALLTMGCRVWMLY
jgi:hypothetical protein